jgi:glycine betaine/proline transport system permease protein
VPHILTHFPASALPVQHWVNRFVSWLVVKTQRETGFIAKYAGDCLHWLEHLFERIPWPLVVLGAGVAGWRLRGWGLGLGLMAALVVMGLLGLWDQGMYTLALVVVATVLCVGIGIPVGIAMARHPGLRAAVVPLLDLMQTMPSFVYLIPALLFFSLGSVPALLATFIYSIPPVVRLTDLGIREVAAELVEAGESFGATPGQLLVKVQLPLALPAIMAGLNQTIMMALAMVVVASMVGAGGLGGIVLTGISQLNVGQGLAGGIGIVILAIVIDRLTRGLVRHRPAAAE